MEARSCFSHSGTSTRVPCRAVQREGFAKDSRWESALFFWMLQWRRHTIKLIPLKQNQLQLWAFCLTFNALLQHLKRCTFSDWWRGNLGPFLFMTPLHLLRVAVMGCVQGWAQQLTSTPECHHSLRHDHPKMGEGHETHAAEPLISI